jgi:hypothetical protein
MAESTVVKEQLTDAMIDAGAKLTSKLDEIGLPLSAAYWMFVADLNEWRLLFASPDVGAKGPRAVYETIGQAIEELGSDAGTVALSDVGVLDADADMVRLLKSALRTGPGVSRIRFSKNVIDGHFIDDALIYRAA